MHLQNFFSSHCAAYTQPRAGQKSDPFHLKSEKKRKINALIADHEQQVKLKQAQESETDDAEASADNRP